MTETEKARYELAMRPIEESKSKKLSIAVPLLAIGMATFVAGYTKGALVIQSLGIPIAVSGGILFLQVERSYRKEERIVRDGCSDDKQSAGLGFY